jgi:predicted nucleic acid-binding protein
MTSSSSPSLERGLDTMLLVYCVLQGHPAAAVCEQFLRSHSGWFTSPLVLFEAKSILTKIYGVDAGVATNKLAQFSVVPVAVLDLDAVSSSAALLLQDIHGLDLTDAVLLHLTHRNGASYLATEDQQLAKAAQQLGIIPESPLDATLRQQIAAWEFSNLNPKGLPRILRRVNDWLTQIDPQTALRFWSQSGGGSHLP